MVASSYLMPAGETLYVVRVARGLDRLKRPARPAKHTRQTYIHEAFPLPLYQTRKGVICFAPFQQCDFDSALAINRLEPNRLHDPALLHRDANTRSDTWTPRMTIRRWEPGRGGRCDTGDAHSVSRRADIVRPVCSREVVTKRRYTTRNNQIFTSEKFAKTVFCGFRTQSYRVLLLGGYCSDPLG